MLRGGFEAIVWLQSPTNWFANMSCGPARQHKHGMPRGLWRLVDRRSRRSIQPAWYDGRSWSEDLRSVTFRTGFWAVVVRNPNRFHQPSNPPLIGMDVFEGYALHFYRALGCNDNSKQTLTSFNTQCILFIQFNDAPIFYFLHTSTLANPNRNMYRRRGRRNFQAPRGVINHNY